MTKEVLLSRAALAALPPAVRAPAYDPAAVRPGIVHLGLGGFHRAHMARYTHDLMNLDAKALAWGIVGAGLLPADRAMRDALAPQDSLYTLVERDLHGEAATVVGSLCGVVWAPGSPEALLEAIDGPGVRIVSLTVTENGYGLDRATKRLDCAGSAIFADLTNPERPATAVGVVVEGLARRRAAGRRPFTVLCCDNIQHNGRVLRQAVLDFAALRDTSLAAWIATEARFPSTMVDRITPVTRVEDVADLAMRLGVVDAWPVFSETFSQWVIEDDFVDGRPEWDQVGAQFVVDVAPYEAMKLRLLNASHLAVAGLGRLIGYRFIDEAMADPRMGRYMRALMDRETGPTLPPVPGVDLEAYKAALLDRFANPAIQDTVDRVNADAPLNLLLDPIRDRLAAGQRVDLLALALAAWMRRVRGVDEAGVALEVRHPMAELLREKAELGGADPRPLLSIEPLFGRLIDDGRFVCAVGAALRKVYALGAEGALSRMDEALTG